MTLEQRDLGSGVSVRSARVSLLGDELAQCGDVVVECRSAVVGQCVPCARPFADIAKRSEKDQSFGKVKLAKLLAFTDFYAIGQTGRSVTGVTYLKRPQGPVPQTFYEALDILSETGRARVDAVEVAGGHTQERVIALDDSSDVLSELDRYFADEMMQALRRYNAAQLSDLAHRQFVGWRLVDMGEAIPYKTHHISPLRPTANEIRRAQALYDEAMLGT